MECITVSKSCHVEKSTNAPSTRFPEYMYINDYKPYLQEEPNPIQFKTIRNYVTSSLHYTFQNDSSQYSYIYI